MLLLGFLDCGVYSKECVNDCGQRFGEGFCFVVCSFVECAAKSVCVTQGANFESVALMVPMVVPSKAFDRVRPTAVLDAAVGLNLLSIFFWVDPPKKPLFFMVIELIGAHAKGSSASSAGSSSCTGAAGVSTHTKRAHVSPAAVTFPNSSPT